MEDSKQQSILATRKMPVSRLPGLPLPSLKDMEKKERWKMRLCMAIDVTAVRWVGNEVVTVTSHFLICKPVKN